MTDYQYKILQDRSGVTITVNISAEDIDRKMWYMDEEQKAIFRGILSRLETNGYGRQHDIRKLLRYFD